jgi:hypothetical protein
MQSEQTEQTDDLELLTGMGRDVLVESLGEDAVAELEAAIDSRQQSLATVCAVVKEARDEAVNGRINAGIESQWDEDDDAYEGFDETNGGRTSLKPEVIGDSIIMPTDYGDGDSFGSTVFVNITGPYCDAAAAKVTDMMLPTDDFPYSIKPTPVPDIDQEKLGMIINEQGMTAGDALEMARQESAKIAERANDRIRDWLIECRWHDEVRKVVEMAARIGTGVLKGPVPAKRKTTALREGQVVVIEETVPVSRSVNPRNCFPDPACGENIHDGAFFLERDTLTSRQLRDLRGMPGYLSDQIDLCLAEGPQQRHIEQSRTDGESQTGAAFERFEVWYYYGTLSRDDLTAATPQGEDACIPEGDTFPAIATLVNDRLIKAHISHLDSGRFPYDFYTWKRISGSPWGAGVARQIRVPQRMLNFAVREMFDNAALTSGPQIAIKRGAVEPADGIYEITPRKLWYLREEEMVSLGDVFQVVNIPTMQPQLDAIIDFSLRMAEETAGLPMLLQGQQGSAPGTATGMNIVNENAHTVLRRLARNMDNLVTEPHIHRYYEYLLIYGEDDEKGDMVIDAQGSSALVEREIQNSAIIQMGQIAMDPMLRNDFKIDPVKWFAEMAKAQRLDPTRFQIDEDEAEGEAGPQIPPEIQQQVQEMEAMLQQLQEENQQLQMRAAGHEIRAQAMIQSKQLDAETRMAVEQYKAQAAEQREHVRGQYQIELEGLKAQLGAVDREISAQHLDIDRGKLELQREALRHQIARLEREMAEKVREFDVGTALKTTSNPLDKGPIGPGTGLTGTIQRDKYGMIPDAVG